MNSILFKGCYYLFSKDLSYFKTNNIIDIYLPFGNNNSLIINTNNIIDMTSIIILYFC